MSSSTANLSNWLAIFHTHGVGPARFQQYLKVDPDLKYIPQGIVPNWKIVETDLEWLHAHDDAAILTLNDDRYPVLLKQIANPPPILYVRGDCSILSFPQLAMVGSRNPSSYGMQVAKYFATESSKLGLIVTSGLAQGIDGACHKAALAVGAKTVAVLGCGIDVVYPLQHKSLVASIIQQGCVVSEFPLATRPEAYNFPRRNRIISGLSLGVLVLEAALNSGSLITADYALEQNREIFAVPGHIKNPNSAGCHKLIAQGAKLVGCLEDIIVELKPLLMGAIRDRNAAAGVRNVSSKVLPTQLHSILSQIDYESTSVDTIVSRSTLSASAVGAMLLELELHNFISAVPGGYVRI